MNTRPIVSLSDFIADMDRQISFIEQRIIKLEELKYHGWAVIWAAHLASFKRLREAALKMQRDEYRHELEL